MLPRAGVLRSPRVLLLLVGTALAALFYATRSQPPAAYNVSPWTLVDDLDDAFMREHTGVKGWINAKVGSALDERKTLLVTGGAGQLGQMLVARLAEDHIVHVLDVQPRPASLLIASNVFYHRGSVLPPSATLDVLFETIAFDGVVHLAAVSIDAWCAPRFDACMDVNAGGTRAVVDRLTDQWLVLASSMDVYGDAEMAGVIDESSARRPVSALGRTKLAAEETVESAGRAAAIVRFADVYGCPPLAAIPSAFLPSLVTGALTSQTIQYSSDAAPSDLLHAADAVDGLLRVVKRLESAAASGPSAQTTVETFNLVNDGKRWTADEIVDIVRAETGSRSPVRDVGAQRRLYEAHGVAEYSNKHAANVLGWAPSTSLQVGLAWHVYDLVEAVATYSHTYVVNHCRASPEFPAAHPLVFVEDERNKHLDKLDKCTVNLAFDHDGFMAHLKCEDGRHCAPDMVKVPSYNWNASFFVVHVEKSRAGQATVRFAERDGHGYLLLVNDNLELSQDSTRFTVEVAPDSSALRLTTGGEQLVSTALNATHGMFRLDSPSGRPLYDMRMTLLCCPSEGDWPLLADDHDSADIRFGTTGQIPFNASRRLATCERMRQAARHHQHKLSTLRKTVDAAAGGDPNSADVRLRTAVPTSARPHEWALIDLPACWNDCGSPTVCVDTGACRCVQAECPDRRPDPLMLHPPTSAASPKVDSALGVHKGHDPVLVDAVAEVDIHDLLLPAAREYLLANADFVKVHVVGGYDGEAEVEAAECHHLQPAHCFSADSILYRAMRHVSVPAAEADLVVLPVYQQCSEFLLHRVMAHARETIPDLASKPIALALTHDWGICEAFEWDIWSARDGHALYPDPMLGDVIVWSVMGDYDSPCYRPHQDVVIPARTCRSDTLRDEYGDLESVKPARERPHLLTWSGTLWGTGKSERMRLVCSRGGAGDRELVRGQGPQSSFLNWEYMEELNNARFCPQPRGIAGWSPRVVDAIYLGCIPVFTAEGSHYPFASFFDWTKISVRMLPTDLDHIERILAAIPLEQVAQMQANLIVVREAFLYATDEAPEEELKRKGPLYFALHEAAMRMRTVYPNQ